jgi:PAS domain S-box-containing protein
MEALAPPSRAGKNWGDLLPATTAHNGHAVQFYDSDAFLAEAVANFLSIGLQQGEPALVIATEAHRSAFRAALAERGHLVDVLIASEQLTLLDAEAMLATFMVAGQPDEERFGVTMGSILERAALRNVTLRAYGEMVDVLSRRGQADAAVRLEELWNEIARVFDFRLLCAYAMDNFAAASAGPKFQKVCELHTHVVPSGTCDIVDDPRGLLNEVARLQQRARALETEIQRRKELEEALREALVSRREAEAELRESQKELVDFFENAVEGLHRVGPDGVILAANRAELEMLGYTREEYVGHHIAEFHVDESVAGDLLERLRRNEVIRGREARLRCKDGSEKHVLINSNACFREGQFVSSRCFTRDISDRVQLLEEMRRRNDELERAVRFSETFVGILGHDLRNPLSGITTAASLLARRADSERVAKPATRILNSGRRMARMIDQLLDFTRIRLGKGLLLDPTDVDLEELCRVAIDEEVTPDNPRLDVKVAGDVTGSWDPDRLAQLVSNLLGNALAHGAGGSVGLRLDGTDAARVVLELDNEGVIPPDVQAVMFEPFKESGDRKTERSSGLGLGLYISQQIVKSHGGTIEVKSSEGEGTRIIVSLPRDPSRVREAAASSLWETAEVDQRTVLIVDDEADIRESLREALADEGYAVVVAANGKQALEILPTLNRPCAVILDIIMPVMSGIELYTAMRANPRLSDIPVVVSTSDPSRAPSGVLIMRKPINLARLLKTVDALF